MRFELHKQTLECYIGSSLLMNDEGANIYDYVFKGMCNWFVINGNGWKVYEVYLTLSSMDFTALVNDSTLQSPASSFLSSSLVSSLAASLASFWASCLADEVRRRRDLFGVLPVESGEEGSRLDEPF